MVMGIEEQESTWRVRVVDPASMDKFRVKQVAAGVQVTLGRVRGTSRWEVQNYIFRKAQFKTRSQVTAWLNQHLKGEIRTLLDFRAWDEWRRRFVNAYMQISEVNGDSK